LFKKEIKMRILFICKYNRFRSQIAEAYFRKINKNKKISFSSAGVIIGKPIADVVRQTAKKLGFKIKGKPKGVEESLLERTDLVVIAADNVPASLFTTRVKEVIAWDIPDTGQSDKEGIEKISRQIMKKIDELNKRLEKNGNT
jgi:protein-tyrosine-phosphatase